jgi:hypothetical protein
MNISIEGNILRIDGTGDTGDVGNITPTNTQITSAFDNCPSLSTVDINYDGINYADDLADDYGEVHFQVEGESFTLTSKELKRIKEILMDTFPEDYL